MATIFTRIIEREIPAHIVAENDNFICFLDINPLVMGHCLVVPKQEVDYIFDLDDQTLTDLHLFSKRVAKGIEKAIDCLRIGTAVIGLEVPHTHVHLVPLNSMDDINFSRPQAESQRRGVGRGGGEDQIFGQDRLVQLLQEFNIDIQWKPHQFLKSVSDSHSFKQNLVKRLSDWGYNAVLL